MWNKTNTTIERNRTVSKIHPSKSGRITVVHRMNGLNGQILNAISFCHLVIIINYFSFDFGELCGVRRFLCFRLRELTAHGSPFHSSFVVNLDVLCVGFTLSYTFTTHSHIGTNPYTDLRILCERKIRVCAYGSTVRACAYIHSHLYIYIFLLLPPLLLRSYFFVFFFFVFIYLLFSRHFIHEPIHNDSCVCVWRILSSIVKFVGLLGHQRAKTLFFVQARPIHICAK